MQQVERGCLITSKLVIAAIMTIPASVFFAGDVALCFGEKNLPFADQTMLGAFFVAWVASSYWAFRSDSYRELVCRACRAFGIAAFLLPVASIVFAITEPPKPPPAFPEAAIVIICLLFGVPAGLIAWFTAFCICRDEKTIVSPT